MIFFERLGLIVLVCFVSATAQSQALDDAYYERLYSKADQVFLARNFLNRVEANPWQVGAFTRSYTYSEPGVMKNSGGVVGVSLAYTHNLAVRPYAFEGVLAYQEGNLKYEGGYMDGTPVTTDASMTLIDIKGLARMGVHSDTTKVVSLATGIRTRLYSGEIYGRGGYRRRIRHLLIPFQGSVTYMYSPKFSISLTLEADLFFMGDVTAYLSDVDNRLPDVELSQGNGMGQKAKVDFKFARVLGDSALHVMPYYENLHVGESNYKKFFDRYLVEPENRTEMAGLDVAMSF